MLSFPRVFPYIFQTKHSLNDGKLLLRIPLKLNIVLFLDYMKDYEWSSKLRGLRRGHCPVFLSPAPALSMSP